MKRTFFQDSPFFEFYFRYRFTTSKKLLGEDSPFPKFMNLKIRRRNDVASLTILEEGEFKLAIDGCIKITRVYQRSENIVLFSCYILYNLRTPCIMQILFI